MPISSELTVEQQVNSTLKRIDKLCCLRSDLLLSKRCQGTRRKEAGSDKLQGSLRGRLNRSTGRTCHILRATGDPGSVMQAPDFRLNSTMFYECMVEFDVHKPVTTVNSVEALFPVWWTRLAVVLSPTLVHLLLLCSKIVLFQFRTRASDLGNA
ncbi:hypothetical protein LB504_005109 [Fusarium proliferatum]|nr:hypothetical protein LB504_005109 [Fusarium proliferatum]